MPKSLWMLLAVGALIIAGGAYVLLASPFGGMPRGDSIVCTADAMQCPDGSWVGRSGPNCEFVCPQGTSTPTAPQTVTLSIGESKTILGVYIKPLSVIEDSRCPIDVQCIQAGTVRVRVTLAGGLGLGEYDATLTLGTPLTTEAESVTLENVLPARKAGTPIAKGDYTFVFKVEKRTSSI